MSQFRGISVVTEPAPQSGEKYRTSEGFSAIKNGMNLTDVDPYNQKIVLGSVLLAAVLIDTLKRRGAGR